MRVVEIDTFQINNEWSSNRITLITNSQRILYEKIWSVGGLDYTSNFLFLKFFPSLFVPFFAKQLQLVSPSCSNAFLFLFFFF